MSTSYRFPYDNIIDADGHIVEPPDVREKYIDPQFRDRTMRIRTNSQGSRIWKSTATLPSSLT